MVRQHQRQRRTNFPAVTRDGRVIAWQLQTTASAKALYVASRIAANAAFQGKLALA
jgi:hypothetical protein